MNSQRLKDSAKWKVKTSGRPNRRGWIRMDGWQNIWETTRVRLDQNGREVPLSPPDEWFLLPTSLFNIYGEWGQWDNTHHQGDWRKIGRKHGGGGRNYIKKTSVQSLSLCIY